MCGGWFVMVVSLYKLQNNSVGFSKWLQLRLFETVALITGNGGHAVVSFLPGKVSLFKGKNSWCFSKCQHKTGPRSFSSDILLFLSPRGHEVRCSGKPVVISWRVSCSHKVLVRNWCFCCVWLPSWREHVSTSTHWSRVDRSTAPLWLSIVFLLWTNKPIDQVPTGSLSGRCSFLIPSSPKKEMQLVTKNSFQRQRLLSRSCVRGVTETFGNSHITQ